MTMLEEVRPKWCDVLINLLECPVCCEIPQSYIYQCTSGHHICKNCRSVILKCPTCEDCFGKTRNYLAEALSDSFEDIMKSLMHPTHKINRHISKNKICVYTQTQEISKSSMGIQTGNIFLNEDKFTQTPKISVSKPAEVHKQHKGTMSRRGRTKLQYPEVGRGNYPCRIGSCNTMLTYKKMIEHLKSSHMDTFCIFQENNSIFKKKSELKYIVPSAYDFAFLINNMGLFFVNITILPTGDVVGVVNAVNNALASKQFTFTLKIGSGEKASIFSGMVKSCRVPHVEAMKNCLFKKNVEMNQVLHNGNFNCSLIIKRSNTSEINHNHIKWE